MPRLRPALPLAAALLLAACTDPAPSTPGPPASGPRPGDPGADAPFADGDPVALDSATAARLVAGDALWARALRLHYDALVVDGHVDTPTEMLLRGYDLRSRNDRGHVDLPRMAEGGLDAAFFSLWVSRHLGEGADATARAMAMLEELERQLAAAPAARIARTAGEVRAITEAGGTAVLLGLEGGHALAGDPAVLRRLAGRGVRYVGLTHTNTNRLADSSQDAPAHGGLSPLGEAMVREMNRLGVIPDVSHASDAALADVLRVSRGPVIASHSSARALVDNPRNLTDDQLRGIAASGGLVMINFYAPTVNGRLTAEVMAAVRARLDREHGGDPAQLWAAIGAEQRARGIGGATLDDVLDHLVHAVRVAGVDHVGLGSDFDGVPELPAGLEDATRLPWVTYGLLVRGLDEEAVRKVLGGNVLRVLEEAEM